MKKLRMILLALFLVIGVSAAGNATTIADLVLPGGSIVVGDKLFSNWSYEVLHYTAGTFDASLVDVVGLDTDPNNPGIRFQAVTGNASPFFVEDFNLLDVEFTFMVSVMNPGWFIDSVSSALEPGDIVEDANGDSGFALVGDDIAELGGPWAPWLEWDPAFGTAILSDSAAFATPLSEVWVTKDITLESLGGSITVNWIDQYFHQTAVPEPSTMLLLGAGLLGLCGAARKKRE